MLDRIVTDQNAFEVAEEIARDPQATYEQVEAACAVLAQSTDYIQQMIAREMRAGMFAQGGAELKSQSAARAATLNRQDIEWPVKCFEPELSHWKTDLALLVGGLVGGTAVAKLARWWFA